MAATRTQTAWEATYRANTAANGAQTATIGPVNTKRAIVSEMTADEILAVGGTAEAGGFNIQMLASDFDSPPEKFQDVEVFGPTLAVQPGLKVVNVNTNNGVYYIQAGDFVSLE